MVLLVSSKILSKTLFPKVVMEQVQLLLVLLVQISRPARWVEVLFSLRLVTSE